MKKINSTRSGYARSMFLEKLNIVIAPWLTIGFLLAFILPEQAIGIPGI